MGTTICTPSWSPTINPVRLQLHLQSLRLSDSSDSSDSSDPLKRLPAQQDLCQSCRQVSVNSSRVIYESQSMAACLAAIVRQDPSSYAHVTSSRSTPHQACHVISSHDHCCRLRQNGKMEVKFERPGSRHFAFEVTFCLQLPLYAQPLPLGR